MSSCGTALMPGTVSGRAQGNTRTDTTATSHPPHTHDANIAQERTQPQAHTQRQTYRRHVPVSNSLATPITSFPTPGLNAPKTRLPMGMTPALLPHTDTSANRQQPTMRSKETRKRHIPGSLKSRSVSYPTPSAVQGVPSHTINHFTQTAASEGAQAVWRYHRLPPLHSSPHRLLPDNTPAWPCRVSCSTTLRFRVHTVAPPYSRNQAPCALTHSSSRLAHPGGILSPTSQNPHLHAPSEYAWAALHSHQKP